jgi:hypothetical protein
MGLFDMFKSGGGSAGMKMPVRFKAKVERKTATQDLVFDVDVKGYFIGRGGKPDFITEQMTVTGMPNMNMNAFFPKEVEEIRKYAMKVEYPKLIGMKPAGGS